MRQEFPRAVKAAAFLRAGGRCEQIKADGCRCTVTLSVGKYQYDHIIADSIGGQPTLENCAVICDGCYGVKNRKDTTLAAKVKRVRDRHIGAMSKSRNPIPGSRGTKWRKRMDGTVERR